VGFAGAAAAVLIGSYAWACSPFQGSHSGLDWICKGTQTTTCDYGLARNLNPTHSLSFYDQASGLTPNGSYNKKFAAGVHTDASDQACNNGTIFTGGGPFIASSTGTWTGKGPIPMPAATGTITVCTAPLDGNDSRNFIVSAHLLWTVM
jgi:hypothetical protein